MVVSGPRRSIASAHGGRAIHNLTFDTSRNFPLEIDNHADTHCFGSNFRPLFWNDIQCSVSPFLDEFGSTENVDICCGATAWTAPSGETLLLIFGQGLWFGNRMDKSLINPNQCRAFGISLCDDPTDPHRDLGIYDSSSDIFIPLHMSGSFSSLLTRCPTEEEMTSCRRIQLSCPDSWDPYDNPFGPPPDTTISSISSAIAAHRATPESSFDIAMRSISTAHCVDSLTKGVLSSSLIPPPAPQTVLKPTDSALTSDRHHPVTPASLSEKLGIGLQTAQRTIEHTTQLGIRSALQPLSRRYRTDIMSNRLRRINTTVFTDTLFSKTPSVHRDTCAQIYTNAEHFYYIVPMTSNNQTNVGNSLQQFTEDVGIPATIVSDGANEMVGRNSDFSKLCHKLRICQRQTEPYSPWQKSC